MNAHEARHDEVLQGYAKRYESEGYAVQLPAGPDDGVDMIARRGGETIFVQVKVTGAKLPSPTLARLAESARRSHSRFVIVVADGTDIEEIELLGRDALAEQVAEARALDPRSSAASLVAYAVLEAAARSAVARCGAQVIRPTAPRALFQQLASLGLISLAEEKSLADFMGRRNKLAHGQPTVRPSPSELADVLAIAERLANELSPPPSS